MGRKRTKATSDHTTSEAEIVTIMNLMDRTKDNIDHVAKVTGIPKSKIKKIHQEQMRKRSFKNNYGELF